MDGDRFTRRGEFPVKVKVGVKSNRERQSHRKESKANQTIAPVCYPVLRKYKMGMKD